MTAETPTSQRPFSRLPNWVCVATWLLLLCMTIAGEVRRWQHVETRQQALTGWLAGRNADWLPFLPLLLLAPLCYRVLGRPKPITSNAWGDMGAGQGRVLSAWCGAIAVCVLAFISSYWVGLRFGDMPPAYHDEFSYLFQARTYLAGRFSFPSLATHPEIFNQMHVLNEGMFASRYFPAVGAWLAPFVAMGHPWLAQQLAQAISATLIFWIGRELADNMTGLWAGVLYALSPGLLLFSNLLLAHHPTLLGLTCFLWAILKARRTQSQWMYLLAGCGLAWAMLCRPMTAAGFALPFGIAFFSWWMRGDSVNSPLKATPGFQHRTCCAIALGAPLVGGMLLMMLINQQITGSFTTSPYQLYTDIYTPRHVYGFNNVLRGEEQLGPKVLDNYDRWAENLTPQLAAQNVMLRIENSLRWTFSIVPLTGAALILLLTIRTQPSNWWLIGASILTLHIAHIPYWFTGIFGWHYVFETTPLWLLILAHSYRQLLLTWQQPRRPLMSWWLQALMAVTVLVNLVTLPPLWPARLDQGIAEISFPRERYAQFRQGIEQLRGGDPAIVFVTPDPADRSIDYISNPPSLTGPVLVARLDHEQNIDELAKLFPDRKVILFDAHNREFSYWKPNL